MSKYPDIKCYFFRNKHAQHTVERIVKDNLHLLPWWVGKLRIVMQGDADEEGVLATIEGEQYRAGVSGRYLLAAATPALWQRAADVVQQQFRH